MSSICTRLLEAYHGFNASYFIIGVVAFSQGVQHLADISI